ncbi:MAG: hypothetical protein ABSD75_07765 [Terriglobales bacterium]|jgi:hypothetical protein
MNSRPAAAKPRHAALPNYEELREFSARNGVDAATTFLYQAVADSPQHGWFIEKIHSLSRETQPSPPPADTKLVIVPGAFHRENPRSGSDGHVVREQARRMGWRVDMIPLASTGSVVENAQTICRWLGQQRDSRIVLASVSKGGSDLKMALHQLGAERAFEPVAVWLNLCGILEGTPVAEWLLSSWQVEAALSRLYCQMLGMSVAFLGDLRRAAGSPLDFELQLPAHIQMISVVGFPLQQHLTSGMARRCHRRLAPYGPNDGGMLLADVCALPGLIYPIWGGDHYLRSGGDMNELIGALLNFVGQELAACPTAPSTTRANR